MKIRCPHCMRVSEIPHVEHGRTALCVCQAAFRIDESTVVEEFSLPDRPPPEFIGRYRIVRYIGRGVSNCVYEGVHPDLGIPVAVKTLHPDYAGDKPTRERFLSAAKIYAKAVQPDIVKVYETGRDANGVPFLAMEFLPGGTLADRLEKTGRFPARETAAIGAAVCRALTVTEGLGIVHRDIKPDNIMIAEDGRYKLTDLGLAKIDASSAAGGNIRVLDDGTSEKAARKTSFGTLEYMSPEQFIDAESCDIRSDIYSLGVTMYQLASGRLPFQPQTRSELRRMHLSVEPLVPSTYMPDIPLDFDYIVLHCIQKNPEDRYASPSELLADLEAFLAGKPLPSTTAGAVPIVIPPFSGQSDGPRRSRVLPIVAAVLFVLVLCAVGLLFLRHGLTRRTHAAGTEQQDRNAGSPAVHDTLPDSSATGGLPSDGSLAGGSTGPVPGATVVAGSENAGLDADDGNALLFRKAMTTGQEALKNNYGFRDAIEELEFFTSFEEYSLEAMGLIAKLNEASKEAVAKFMLELDRKAEPFLLDGDYDGAIGVYSIEVGPLATESKVAREEMIFELEKERRENEAWMPAPDFDEEEESPQ